MKKELIFGEPLPTPECHASTVIKMQNGSCVAAWFGGVQESKNDVTIWSSVCEDGVWSTPRSITPQWNIPQWNPVLFENEDGTITLYYKVGYKIVEWKTYFMTSCDGKTWSEPQELITGDETGGRGPVKNKPIRISNGKILAPASTENGPWRCFIDIYDGEKWEKKLIPVTGEGAEETNVIQPTLWEEPKGHIHALMRSNQSRIYRSDSEDYGETWSSIYPTEMPNNNSGIDCVMTENKTLVLVCNPIATEWGELTAGTKTEWASRSPLSVYYSQDNGATFEKFMDLETGAGEYSYPAIVAKGNRVYITYTWRKKKVGYCEIDAE
ncbi:MAG: exo-alpha-sialidase [Clostridia bacterium]|nr:exo-alpha-sialidase [Clostridia bacterium]